MSHVRWAAIGQEIDADHEYSFDWSYRHGMARIRDVETRPDRFESVRSCGQQSGEFDRYTTASAASTATLFVTGTTQRPSEIQGQRQ
jgi:hypothetical protein